MEQCFGVHCLRWDAVSALLFLPSNLSCPPRQLVSPLALLPTPTLLIILNIYTSVSFFLQLCTLSAFESHPFSPCYMPTLGHCRCLCLLPSLLFQSTPISVSRLGSPLSALLPQTRGPCLFVSNSWRSQAFVHYSFTHPLL